MSLNQLIYNGAVGDESEYRPWLKIKVASLDFYSSNEQSALSYYNSPESIPLTYSNGTNPALVATMNIVRVGDLVTVTISPSTSVYTVSVTGALLSTVNIPLAFRPLENVNVSVPAIISGSAVACYFLFIVDSNGLTEFSKLVGAANITAQSYIFADFSFSYKV